MKNEGHSKQRGKHEQRNSRVKERPHSGSKERPWCLALSVNREAGECSSGGVERVWGLFCEQGLSAGFGMDITEQLTRKKVWLLCEAIIGEEDFLEELVATPEKKHQRENPSILCSMPLRKRIYFPGFLIFLVIKMDSLVLHYYLYRIRNSVL